MEKIRSYWSNQFTDSLSAKKSNSKFRPYWYTISKNSGQKWIYYNDRYILQEFQCFQKSKSVECFLFYLKKKKNYIFNAFVSTLLNVSAALLLSWKSELLSNSSIISWNKILSISWNQISSISWNQTSSIRRPRKSPEIRPCQSPEGDLINLLKSDLLNLQIKSDLVNLLKSNIANLLKSLDFNKI